MSSFFGIPYFDWSGPSDREVTTRDGQAFASPGGWVTQLPWINESEEQRRRDGSIFDSPQSWIQGFADLGNQARGAAMGSAVEDLRTGFIDMVERAQRSPYNIALNQLPPQIGAPPSFNPMNLNKALQNRDLNASVDALINSQNTPIKEQIKQTQQGLGTDLRTLAFLDRAHNRNLRKVSGEQAAKDRKSAMRARKAAKQNVQSYNADMNEAQNTQAGMLSPEARAQLQAEQRSGTADIRSTNNELAQFEAERAQSGQDYMNQIIAAAEMQGAENAERVRGDAAQEIDTYESQMLANNQQRPALAADMAQRLVDQSLANYNAQLQAWDANNRAQMSNYEGMQNWGTQGINRLDNQDRYGTPFPDKSDIDIRTMQGQPPDPIAELKALNMFQAPTATISDEAGNKHKEPFFPDKNSMTSYIRNKFASSQNQDAVIQALLAEGFSVQDIEKAMKG